MIAETTRVPIGYLAKILQGLARHGLIVSQRGLHGGFTLLRSPSDLCLYDVVQAIDPISNAPLIWSAPAELTVLETVTLFRSFYREGSEPEGRASSTSPLAVSVSPGRTGSCQRTASMPGEPRQQPASAPVCQNMRNVSARLWKPLAISPP